MSCTFKGEYIISRKTNVEISLLLLFFSSLNACATRRMILAGTLPPLIVIFNYFGCGCLQYEYLCVVIYVPNCIGGETKEECYNKG